MWRPSLNRNIAGEQCAISTYKSMRDITKDKDMVTYNLSLTIPEQEVEHKEDLQSLLEDLELMVGRGMAGRQKERSTPIGLNRKTDPRDLATHIEFSG